MQNRSDLQVCLANRTGAFFVGEQSHFFCLNDGAVRLLSGFWFSKKSRTLKNNHLGGSRFGRHTSNMSVIPHHTRTWWKAIGADVHKTFLCRLVNLSWQIQSCFLTSHKMRTFRTSFSLNLVSYRSKDFGSTCLGRRSCVGPFQSGVSRFQTGYGHAWVLAFVKPKKRKPADIDGHFRPAEPQHEGMPIRMFSRRHHTQLLDGRPWIPRDHETLSFWAHRDLRPAACQHMWQQILWKSSKANCRIFWRSERCLLCGLEGHLFAEIGDAGTYSVCWVAVAAAHFSWKRILCCSSDLTFAYVYFCVSSMK